MLLVSQVVIAYRQIAYDTQPATLELAQALCQHLPGAILLYLKVLLFGYVFVQGLTAPDFAQNTSYSTLFYIF